MKAPEMVTNDRAGVLDAQVNYWLTKLQLEDDGKTIAVPEYNLADGGASFTTATASR